MSSVWGHKLKLSLFGQSHGPAVGMVLDGLPAGEPIDEAILQRLLDRRAPRHDGLSTARQESDRPIWLAGLMQGHTCGAPLCALLRNQDAHPQDYAPLADTPRPGHADYTAWVKYKGQADMRGGGHFSGRLTAPLTLAGGVALQLLARQGITIGAHLAAVGTVDDVAFDSAIADPAAVLAPGAKDFPVIDDECGAAMQALIRQAAAAGDSIGGIIEAVALGLPPGLGAPHFDGMENRLAQALFAIPAVNGVEFGAGFAAARMRGSEHNDPFIMAGKQIKTVGNHHGGCLGGLSSGMPLRLRLAVKPTSSIAAEQATVDLRQQQNTTLRINGRHDPCIALRAVPVAEAVCALVLLDILWEEKPELWN